MPVPAVRCGGRLIVSSGSISASRGIKYGLPMASLRPESMMMTPPRLTSLPVPEVVGIATMGATAAEKSTVSDGALNAVKAQIEEMVEAAPVPLACSIDNPDCEACQ